MPCCSVDKPTRISAKPAMALPAAANRPRPTTLSSAPTNTIGRAAAVSEIRTPNAATSQPVPVVPILAPKTRLRPCGKVSSPALTSPIVVIVVALDDCTMSVITAPQNVPSSGVAAAFSITVLRAVPASALSPSVITAMPRRNRPTPPTIETRVSKFPPGHCVFVHSGNIAPLARREALVDEEALNTTCRVPLNGADYRFGQARRQRSDTGVTRRCCSL